MENTTRERLESRLPAWARGWSRRRVLAVAAVVVRFTHALGMLRSASLASHGPLRDIGALGTYLVGVALGVTAIVTI